MSHEYHAIFLIFYLIFYYLIFFFFDFFMICQLFNLKLYTIYYILKLLNKSINYSYKKIGNHLLIPVSRFLFDICNESLNICGESTKVFMMLIQSTDVLIMKSCQPLNQRNVSSGQPWLRAAQRDFKKVLHSMVMACSFIWIQDIDRMPWSLPPSNQIIHHLIGPPNSIDRIQTVPKRNSVHPRSSYVVTIIFRNSLDIGLPSKWGTISVNTIKYEITNTFLV